MDVSGLIGRECWYPNNAADPQKFRVVGATPDILLEDADGGLKRVPFGMIQMAPKNWGLAERGKKLGIT